MAPSSYNALPAASPSQTDRRTPPLMAISPLVARSHSSQPLPDVTLEFLNGPSRSTCWPMNRVMSLIGSAGGCKFRLADPSVAPFHCSLLRSPVGLWVVDLLGPDGIGVNDAPVRYALLTDNDVLKVGRYRIRIRSRFPGRDPDVAREQSSTVHAPGDPGRHPHSDDLGLPVAFPETAGFPAVGPVAWQGSLSRAISSLRPASQASQIEWVPPPSSPGSGEPARLDNGELADSVLIPLVNQFGMMQQQMMDQFQQTVSMLVQMFGSLHRDQMDLIREELDQLRDLTKEFQTIKVELAALSRGTGSGELARAAPRHRGVSWGRLWLRGPVCGNRRGIPRSAPQKLKPLRRPRTVPRPMARRLNRLRMILHRRRIAPRDSDSRPRDLTGEESQDADRDVIVWLHQRMMTLQQRARNALAEESSNSYRASPEQEAPRSACLVGGMSDPVTSPARQYPTHTHSRHRHGDWQAAISRHHDR